MQTNINEHKICEFSIGDKDLVVEFFDQMGGETRGFFDRGGGNRRNALEFFNKNGDEPNVKRFMSYVSDKAGKKIMTGYVFAWDIQTGVPTLGIAVRDEYKGMGLGKILIGHLTDYLKSINCGGVMLTTSFANIRGQGLYTNMGFEHIGTHTSGELLYILKFTNNTETKR